MINIHPEIYVTRRTPWGWFKAFLPSKIELLIIFYYQCYSFEVVQYCVITSDDADNTKMNTRKKMKLNNVKLLQQIGNITKDPWKHNESVDHMISGLNPHSKQYICHAKAAYRCRLILKWLFDPEVKAKGTEPDLQITC